MAGLEPVSGDRVCLDKGGGVVLGLRSKGTQERRFPEGTQSRGQWPGAEVRVSEQA